MFNKVFPITDFSGVAELRFVKYELEEPKYDVEECIQRGGTYGSLLKVTLNLIIREIGFMKIPKNSIGARNNFMGTGMPGIQKICFQ